MVYSMDNKSSAIYSKSFKTAGCAMAKAIGAYYSTQRPVSCFIGDQGFQMNIQELQFIAQNKVPIMIVLLNNLSSGMLRTEEIKRFNTHFIHTTLDSGYSVPDFCELINAYGLNYYFFDKDIICELNDMREFSLPCVIELRIDESIGVLQSLPRGRALQDFDPPMDSHLYEELDIL